VNCGHPAPILLRADGSVERLDSTATVLGVFKDWSSEEGSTTLAAGDKLVLFSDGVTEAGVETEAEFGEDGLLAVIRANQGVDARALVSVINAAVAVEKDDDVTVVVITSSN
jgi:sigma-B regulation protein RsbU (phosphoserine phosphatase)